MMGTVESDEDSGPRSVAEREPGPTCHPFLSHAHMTLCCPSLPFIIHDHYRHLLILIHVNDCLTTSLTLVLSFAPLIQYIPSATHDPSVSTYTYFLDYDTWSKRSRHSLFPFFSCPSISIFLTPLRHCISSGSPFLFFPLPSHNRPVLYILHARWHARLLSTIYLIDNSVTHRPAIRKLADVHLDWGWHVQDHGVF